MRGATTTNLIFSLSRYTIIDIEIKFRERGMLCNDKHIYQHFIKVWIYLEGHKNLATSCTYNLTLQINVKYQVKDGLNFCGLLRISEL